MSPALVELRQQTHRAWLQLGWPRGVALILVSCALAVLLVAVGVWARTPSYRVAYSNLSEEDASAIVTHLKELQIPYQLESGGSRILVPDNLVEDVRLETASARLPSSGAGFELFDKTQLGATDYAQRINYQRALEGELARTIARLSPIEQARVHLAMPTPSLYLDREKPATASVMVKLRPGQRLSESQIRGIAHLVSGSIPGLELEHLSIVDTSGAVLSGGLAKGLKGPQTGEQADVQLALENRIERDILAMLETVVGQGKASVRVNAAMNWDQQETSTETYQPAGATPLVRSAKELSENYDRGAAPTGGVPGAAANLPTYQQPGGDGQGAYTRKESSTNYELAKSTARVVRAPGSITRLSVAVALDGAEPITPEHLEQLRGLVEAAAGLDSGRGDTLAISSLPFSTRATEDQQRALALMQEQQQREMFIEGLRAAGAALGPALLLVMLFFLLRRMRRAAPDLGLKGSARMVPVPSLDVTSAADPSGFPALAPGAASLTQRALNAANADQINAVEELSRLARTQPTVLVQTLTAWLEEDRGGTQL